MVTRAFPKEEQYGVTAQLRRSALSVPTNIVEGYSRKGSRELLPRLHAPPTFEQAGFPPYPRPNVPTPEHPRLLRVVHVLYSFGTGGLEKGIATVIRNASPGFEHVVLCLATSGPSARLLPPGTRVVELHKPAGNSPPFLWRLSRELKRLQPDVVHTRNWSGIDGMIAARLAGIRGVVHGEHGWGMEDPDGLNPRRLRVRRFVQRWVREYTCVSQAMVGWLREDVGIRRPITQIYNGVDTDQYRPDPLARARVRCELGLAEDAFVAGVVGRLDPIKDHPTLLAAFGRLRAEHPEARLLIIGDGPERARLEALAGDGVLFLGDRGDVPELMRALDVFVLPSRNEGISNTILEAMASGLPVVATRVGGNAELVAEGNTGVLLEAGDPIAMGGALRRYASDPPLGRADGTAGRGLVVTRFRTADMVTAYEGVWRRGARCAVGRGGGRGTRDWGGEALSSDEPPVVR